MANVKSGSNQPKSNVTKKSYKTNKVKSVVPNMPQHIKDIVMIVKYNAGIRRHVALNLLKINNIDKGFVEFKWDKYIVIADKKPHEFNYDKNFVLALIEAHKDLANDSQKTISNFITKENIELDD